MERIPEFIANHLFLFSLLLSILILLAWNFFGDNFSGIKALTPEEVTHYINREDAKVIDLRSQSDFEKGHVIDALNITPDQLVKQQNKLNPYKDKGIILCCANGAVSMKEAKRLRIEGFEKIFTMKGGIFTWQGASLPLTKGSK